MALNYCRASFHRIRKYPSARVLLEEQEKILNNLDLNGIADEEVIRLYTGVLDEIGAVQIADHEREVLKDRYKQTFRRQLAGNVFLMGTQVASAQLGAAVRSGVNSWWDYREMGVDRELDLWKVDKKRITDVVNKSSTFLDTFWKMAQKKNIPDRWLVRGDDLDRLEAAIQEPDPTVRLRILRRMERFMECYPPYWYHVARTQQTLGQLFAAGDTYDHLADLAAGHFRKDDMLAAALANRAVIQEYLKQPTAAKTAQEALHFSTAVWEANLMCAQVLERDGQLDVAEDAILRNLDVDLESEQSLIALLSLYYQSNNETKLISRLSNLRDVVRIPAPTLLQCAAKLGESKTPPIVFQHIADSLFGYPDLHFGPDDLVFVAAQNWQISSAQMTLEFAGQRFQQPRINARNGSYEVVFADIFDLGNLFKPISEQLQAVLELQYPGELLIRVHLQQGAVLAVTEGEQPDLDGNSAEFASRGKNALRVSAIDVGMARLTPSATAEVPQKLPPLDAPVELNATPVSQSSIQKPAVDVPTAVRTSKSIGRPSRPRRLEAPAPKATTN